MEADDPIPFRPLMRHRPVEIYTGGHLPHWRQNGCTYFVTFRTADSLPQSILREVAVERASWLERHGGDLSGLSEELRNEFAKLFSARIEEKLDSGFGQCPLRDPDAATIVAEALQYHDSNRFRLGDFVVMPNHVHALVTPAIDEPLEKSLESIKKYSARRINTLKRTSGTFWQRDTYDHIVRTGKQLEKFQQYIADNPGKAGLSRGEYLHRPARYRFS